MDTDNTLLRDLMVNFDTFAMGEGYKAVDVAAAHIGCFGTLVTEALDHSQGIAISTIAAEKLVKLARDILDARAAKVI